MNRYLGLLLSFLSVTIFFSCDDKISQTESPVIVITEPDSVSCQKTTINLVYTIENVLKPGKISVSNENDWITNLDLTEDGLVSLVVEQNDSPDPRSGMLVFSYPKASDLEICICQKGKSKDPDPDPDPEENALSLEVSDVKTFSAKVKVVPSNENLTYLLLTKSASDFEAFDSDSELVASDMAYFEQVAQTQGVSLELLLEVVLLRKGTTEGVMDTFLPDSPYYIYTYGIDKFQTTTTEIYKEKITTLPLTVYDEDITLTASEVGSRHILVDVIPDSDKFRYYAGYMTGEEYLAFKDDFITKMLAELELIIQMNNALGSPMTWDDLTNKGKTSLKCNSLFSATEYVFFAFGIDNGYSNTDLFTEKVITSEIDVTDDCTFGINMISVDSYGAVAEIVPSSEQTRYFSTYIESSSLSGLSPEIIADACINAAEEAGINWKTSDLISTGRSVMEMSSLAPITKYTMIVFGVSTDGERTTEVALSEFTTGTVPPSDMTFEVSIVETGYSYVNVNVIPSANDEEYVFCVLSEEDYKSYGYDAKSVMNRIQAENASGVCVRTFSGTQQVYEQMDWNFRFLEPGVNYVVFVYGASYWYPTTPASVIPFETPERVVSDALVDIELTVYDGNDLISYDPVKYPESKWRDRAAIKIDFIPNSYTSEWYGWLETRSAENLSQLNLDVLLGVIKSRGQKFDNPAPGSALVQAPWNYQNYSAVSLGVSRDGYDGKPVILSLCVDRSQIVPFDPSALSSCRVCSFDSGSKYPNENVSHTWQKVKSVRHSRGLLLSDSAIKNAIDRHNSISKPAPRSFERIVHDNVRAKVLKAGGKFIIK